MTRSARWLLAPLALLVLGGLWQLTRPGPDPGGQDALGPSTITPGPEREARGGPESPDEALSGSGELLAPADTPQPIGDREEIPLAPVQASPTFLRVVDAATGAPVAGASVRLWHGGQEDLRLVAFELAYMDRFAHRSLGEHFREEQSDAEGRVPVLGPGPWTLALASLDELEVALLVDRAVIADEVLQLVPATSTLVRVRDTLGNPKADATFAIAVGDVTRTTRMTTDGDGDFRLGHVGGLLGQLGIAIELDASTPWAVSSGFFGEEIPEDLAGAEADPNGPPPEPGAMARLEFPGAPAEVVLETLPMGTLRVELFDPNGRPTRVSLPQLEFELELRGHAWDHLVSEYDPGDTLEIPLPSSASFQVEFRDIVDYGSEPHTFEGVVPGPNQPPLVWAITTGGVQSVTYRMVLQDGSGQPLSATSLRTKFKGKVGSGGSTASSSARTDGSGELELELPVILGGLLDEEDLSLHLTLKADLEVGEEIVPHELTVPLPIGAGSPRVDLGVLTLVPVVGG